VTYYVSVDVADPALCVAYPDGSFDYAGVGDTWIGHLGEVVFGYHALPRVFGYTRLIGPYNICGDYTVDNTAGVYYCGGWTPSVSRSMCRVEVAAL